ncbi:hypothetical protein GLOIN_2v1765743 [Rhizophagus clarus]|uniref:Uncharacterized protein n=1 Tax=Rhizophagus clarus TaxID=94130 RepID=A0A8H3R6P9_9GLOM|nr:hypothetical protein GLOIN_2v1765743 [Rhizophagus clarus]
MRKLYKNELNRTELPKASEGIKSFNQRYEINIPELMEDTNCILDKTYSKIDLDRICIITDTQEEYLLNSKEEIHSEAINTFSALFRLQNHKFENLSEQWKAIYKLRADINLQIYDHLDDIPMKQEWYEMLNTMNDKSAPEHLYEMENLPTISDSQDIRLRLQSSKDATDLID